MLHRSNPWRALPCGALLLATLAAPLAAQTRWIQKPARPFARAHAAAAYDASRGVTVMSGGIAGTATPRLGTWERDASGWHAAEYDPGRANTAQGPREGAGMFHDAARGYTVMFGGSRWPGKPRNGTWLWDGASWSTAATTTTPGGRMGVRMAYDSHRQRGVLFGGILLPGTTPNAETWEWHGDWTRRTTATTPPARRDHALAYDAARRRTVLFGGQGLDQSLADTWEWDGVDWVRRRPAVSPPARVGHALAYDEARARVVLFGGRSPETGQVFADTWEWDGATWTQRSVAAAPPARYGHVLVYESALGVTMLHGGAAFGVLDDTWLWDGFAWTEVTRPTPGNRSGHQLAYDSARQRVVLFGEYAPFGVNQLSETWEWDGSSWSLRATGGPPVRTEHAMAFDRSRGQLVVFGGVGLGDTWEWDGAQWLKRTPSVAPAPRWGHAMAYDPARGRTVLFGGYDYEPIYFGDTWEWDGASWTLVPTPTAPSPRRETAMAYDARRGVVVLFGGLERNELGDTWEWDGRTWTQRQPATSPAPRSSHGMVYDEARGRVVLFGGLGVNGIFSLLDDTWEWDGQSWTQRSTPAKPFPSYSFGMAYDAARRQTVLYGTASLTRDTWVYEPVVPARYDRFGAGCAGSAGTPTLDAVPGRLPWLGETLVVQAASLPPGRTAWMLFGASNTTFGGSTLPFDLGAIGMTGCQLLVSLEVAVPIANPAGTATLATPIPALPDLLGAAFYQQVFVADPGTNPLGFVVSNGGAATLGGL